MGKPITFDQQGKPVERNWLVLAKQLEEGAAAKFSRGETPQSVLRVRFFIGDTIVDEDLVIPELPPWTPQDSVVLEAILTPQIEARYQALTAA